MVYNGVEKGRWTHDYYTVHYMQFSYEICIDSIHTFFQLLARARFWAK